MKCKVVKKDSSDINKQLLEILNRYDNKPVDFEFVKEVLMILRKHYHCEATLKKMLAYKRCSSDSRNSWSGVYSHLNHCIYINTASMDNTDFSINERNVMILCLIFHEFIHAMQEKITIDCFEHSNFDNFEFKLNVLSNSLEGAQNYNNIYYADPIERWAYIKSHIWCINVLSLDEEKYFDLIKQMEKKLYTYILMNYKFANDISVSPLVKFLLLTNNQKYMDLIDEDEFSLKKRVLYGLPISYEEYVKIQSKYIACIEGLSQNKLKKKKK